MEHSNKIQEEIKWLKRALKDYLEAKEGSQLMYQVTKYGLCEYFAWNHNLSTSKLPYLSKKIEVLRKQYSEKMGGTTALYIAETGVLEPRIKLLQEVIEELEMNLQVENLVKSLEIIHSQKESQGQIDCPACGNKLSYVKQHNGHVWGKCETENCLNWVQ